MHSLLTVGAATRRCPITRMHCMHADGDRLGDLPLPEGEEIKKRFEERYERGEMNEYIGGSEGKIRQVIKGCTLDKGKKEEVIKGVWKELRREGIAESDIIKSLGKEAMSVEMPGWTKADGREKTYLELRETGEWKEHVKKQKEKELANHKEWTSLESELSGDEKDLMINWHQRLKDGDDVGNEQLKSLIQKIEEKSQDKEWKKWLLFKRYELAKIVIVLRLGKL